MEIIELKKLKLKAEWISLIILDTNEERIKVLKNNLENNPEYKDVKR